MTESAATEAKIEAARARWDAECATQARARAAEVARDRWSAHYPETD
jgi:hypothetical protein